MKNRQTILTIALVFAILTGNALLLPKLLDRARALPEGTVVTQQRAVEAERVPLPEPPEGFGEPYELNFSRELTPEERKIWDDLEAEMREDEALYYPEPEAVFFTERAWARAIEAARNTFSLQFIDWFTVAPLIGDGSPGTILMDLGNVTLCVGERPLTREIALPLMRNVFDRGGFESNLDQMYDQLYWDFDWMKPQENTKFAETRALNNDELQKYSALKTEYALSGLRPSTPLPTSETPNDSLWFDERARIIHLPKRYELTEDEALQYIGLKDSLVRQALLDQAPDMITEQQAVETAKEWAIKLFDWEVDAFSVFVDPIDGSFFTQPEITPIWRVRFAPSDMLIRESKRDYAFTCCMVELNAVDGSLIYADRTYSLELTPPVDLTVEQVKEILGQKALDTARTLFAETGDWPVRVAGVSVGYINPYALKQSGGTLAYLEDDAVMPYTVEYVVSLKGGVDCQMTFTTGDYALTGLRYWPNGCKDMG